MKMTVAEPVSFSPNSHRGSSMKLAPTKLATAPTAVASAFIVHDLLARHDARQRSGQAGGDEPADAVDQQSSGKDRPVVRTDRQQRPDAGDQYQPRRVGADQNITAVPPIQQRSGERPEQRVRQEQHRERPRDVPRCRSPIGIEQDGAGQPAIEQTVAELAGDPHPEQPAELGQPTYGSPHGDRCAHVNHRSHFPPPATGERRGTYST